MVPTVPIRDPDYWTGLHTKAEETPLWAMSVYMSVFIDITLTGLWDYTLP